METESITLYVLPDRKKRSLSHVRFTSINLSNIDKDILSSFLTKLTAVILDLNYLTLAQTAAIFCKVIMAREREVSLVICSS